MFQNLKKPIIEVEQGWLKNAIYSSINDVANQWPVDSIFNHREQFEAGIIHECNKRVNKWFTVSQLRSNIVPPPSLQAAIINKTKAIQEAQGEVQKAIVADAQAKVKIANSRGDSAQIVIAASANAAALLIDAEAVAKAMKLKQAQLSSLYVEYIKAQTWDGKLPTHTLGSGGTFVNLK
jgi:regulator of protease activity HflC (stomatin/prohibitin superfamily)